MSLLRNFATVGSATASSRVLGFIRDIFIAAALGTGPVADAFFVAQRLPNLFRRLFAEGAFSSAFVPLFTKHYEAEGPEAAHRFASEALAALALALIVFTVLAELGMVWLTYGLAPGFAAEPAKFDMTVLFSRIAFPYLLLISLGTLLAGALNGTGRFAAAAFSQSLLNVVLIGALFFLWWTGEVGTVRAGILLTASIMLGGLIQLAFLAIACRRAGIRLRLLPPRWTTGVKRLTRLALPSVLAGGITQINIAVGTIIASLQAGAVSWLYYADRLYQLPLGIVGIAIGVVLLPDLSRALGAGKQDAVDYIQNRSIEFAAALTLPATVALLVIPGPIIQVLFERAAITAIDTAATAPALAAYAAGLPAFVAIKVLQPGYFAREDTRMPMWAGLVTMLVNVIAAFALFWWFVHIGIAAATSIAAWLNTAILFIGLRRRGQLNFDANLRRRLPLLLVASLLMGVVVYVAARLFAPWLLADSVLTRAGVMVALVMIGLIFFALFCQVARIIDFRRLVRMFFDRT